MTKTPSINIENVDFSYEHSPVKIIANRNIPEIKLPGIDVGPFEEGNEYEIQFWIAKELEKAGIARFRQEELLDAKKLHRFQWTEHVQTAGQISKLPDDFYPKLRRYLMKLKEDATRDPEKLREYEKSRHLTQDIMNSRLKKIVSVASGLSQTEQVVRNFASEERFLYEQLRKLIQAWRTRILECKEMEE